MNDQELNEVIQRIARHLPTAAGLMPPTDPVPPTAVRHLQARIEQIRDDMARRYTQQMAIAATLASLEAQGVPSQVALRIMRAAVPAWLQGNTQQPLEFHVLVHGQIEARRAWAAMVVAAWVTNCNPAVTAWLDAAEDLDPVPIDDMPF